MSDQDSIINTIENIVNTILENKKLTIGEWHLGKVEQVISNKLLSVFVDGSTTPQKIPCNPDVTFNIDDEVEVHFRNRDAKDKYIPYKRGV